MKYDRCPQCELNYKLKESQLCEICLNKEKYSDEVDIKPDVCPYCEKHILALDEDMCIHCKYIRNIHSDDNL